MGTVLCVGGRESARGSGAQTLAAAIVLLSEAGGSGEKSRAEGPRLGRTPPPRLRWLGAASGLSLRCWLSALRPACSDFGMCRDVPVHTAPRSSAAQGGDAPAVETLPSALLTGHFYYLGYLRRYLARCRPLAVLGEGKSCWSKWTL